MPANPTEKNESLSAAVTEVSEKLTVLIREEIELAKVEVTEKATSLGRGAAAVAVGAVFGVFALIFVLLTIAWAINDATGDLWLGFAIVMVLLILLTAGAFLFAWRKLKVGAPTPNMAIDEAKKIRATVKPEGEV
ncbi:MAG: phage holin family protein [Solirubrobacteraceae bacterium]